MVRLTQSLLCPTCPWNQLVPLQHLQLHLVHRMIANDWLVQLDMTKASLYRAMQALLLGQLPMTGPSPVFHMPPGLARHPAPVHSRQCTGVARYRRAVPQLKETTSLAVGVTLLTRQLCVDFHSDRNSIQGYINLDGGGATGTQYKQWQLLIFIYI